MARGAIVRTSRYRSRSMYGFRPDRSLPLEQDGTRQPPASEARAPITVETIDGLDQLFDNCRDIGHGKWCRLRAKIMDARSERSYQSEFPNNFSAGRSPV